MRFLVMISRSLLGMAAFNLPMRFIPHQASGRTLVFFMALTAAALNALDARVFEASFCLVVALFFRKAGTESAQTQTSVWVSLGYILMASEIISLIARFALQLDAVGVAHLLRDSVNSLVSLWQTAIIVVYTRLVADHHRKLSKASTESSM